MSGTWGSSLCNPSVRQYHNFIPGFSKSFLNVPAWLPARGRHLAGVGETQSSPTDLSNKRAHT